LDNTRYLLHFGRRELAIAGLLLRLFRSPQDRTVRLGEHVTPEFNPDSGMVFLIDDQFNVAVERNGYLEDWIACPTCLKEDFADSPAFTSPCCKSHLRIEFSEK
jgi:hypothetical protein